MNVSEEGNGSTKMPLHTNNVDGSVAANMLFGITNMLVQNFELHSQFIDEEIK